MPDDFLKMDMFFATTTAAVILFGTLGGVIFVYMIKILRSVDKVMKNVASESDNVRDDIALLRDRVTEEGLRIQHLVDFFFGTRRTTAEPERTPPKRRRTKVVKEAKGDKEPIK